MGTNSDDTLQLESNSEMRIYNGQIRRVVDDKNRLNIPSRFRDARYSEFHALPDSNNPCLKLLNADELRRMKRTLDESPDFSPADKKKFRRLWFARATPCPIDKQGRIVIPPDLQERYKFSGEVVIAGVCECLELWHPEDWDNLNQGTDGDAIDINGMADRLGF